MITIDFEKLTAEELIEKINRNKKTSNYWKLMLVATVKRTCKLIQIDIKF